MLFTAHCAGVAAFSALPYLPLKEFISWTYREGSSTYTAELYSDPWWIPDLLFLSHPLPSGFWLFTNDARGVLIHSNSTLLKGILGPLQGIYLYDQPFTLANADITLGATVVSSGNAGAFVEGVGSVSGTYSGSSRPVGFETVTTPLGTFHALRFDHTLSVSLTINHQVRTASSASSSWLASGIGIVKDQTSVDGGPPKITHLMGTNIPGAFRPGAFTLPALMMLLE